MQVLREWKLSSLTTLGVGGIADRVVVVTDAAELVAAVRAADEAGTPLLVLGGGSNVVAPDAGWPGDVVAVRNRGIERDGATLTVQAGEPWDDVVAYAVGNQLAAIEALSGIPGTTGATPIQNVGAYGQEVAETIASVRCWDRVDGVQRTFAASECGFGYRTSRFKQDPQRHVVLAVTFQFRLGELAAPVRYAELARSLGVQVGARVPMTEVRDTVLRLRRRKGMVLDAEDHDTWSAGSFFTNPFLDADAADRLPAGAPRWEQADGTTKTSAAWLIENAGFGKGYGNGRAALSGKHTLALTNRGAARTDDLLALAAEVQRGVYDRFGIWLVNEPVLVGCDLPVPA